MAQPLEIIVEFPDGHPRPLVRTTLYVDGQIAAENTAEPFNAFTWDLTATRRPPNTSWWSRRSIRWA